MNRALIILGMHRSGTSALMGSLEEGGVYVGDVNSYSPDNIKGNRELREIVTLNEDILNRSGGSWDSPVTKIQWGPLHTITRDLILGQFKDKPIWGFKDPRTVFVLNGWMKAVPIAELICIFRHPFFVADSLKRRNSLSYSQGLKLWINYNRTLKWHIERNSNVSVIEFTQSNSLFKKQLGALHSNLGLVPSKFEFYNPGLMQDRLPELYDEPESREALSIYTNLQQHLPVDFRA